MSDPTDERMQFDAIIVQYRAKLERLNYARGSINVYLRSIRKLCRLMEEHGVTLGDLTTDVAADLVRRDNGTATARKIRCGAATPSSEKIVSRIAMRFRSSTVASFWSARRRPLYSA